MKFSYAAVVLVVLYLMMFGSSSFADRGGVARCEPPMIKSPLGKYCYDFQPNPAKLTWMGAQDFCGTKGGNLVTLHSVKEVEFILHKMSEQNIDYAYAGLRAFSNRTQWLWLDDHMEIDPTVADWMPGQPDFANGAEHCAYVDIKANLFENVQKRKILQDYSCDKSSATGFICKIPLKLGKAKNRKNVRPQTDDFDEGQDKDDYA